MLASENGHFARIWEGAPRVQRTVLEALARDPGRPPLSAEYRRVHNLPGPSSVQTALRVLVDDELAVGSARGYRIAEPFLREWIVTRDL